MSTPSPLPWTGPTCCMCHGTGVYPYHPHPTAIGESGPVKWAICGACYGNGRDAYTDEDLAKHDAWVEAEFARGVCPYSGMSRHACHRSVCDCFDSWGCPACADSERDSMSGDLGS